MNDTVMTEYADFVDESVIEKYMGFEKKLSTKLSPWKAWYTKALTAACACVVLFVLGVIFLDKFPANEAPYFVLKAYAANGDIQELNLYEGVLNSGYVSSETNEFGVDQPLFKFCIALTDSTGKRMTVFDVNVSIFYNGREVDFTNDKHIRLSYMFPSQESDKPSGFVVLGWFNESTDIVIKINDKKSGETLESYILNVSYLSKSEEYLLTLIESNTNCTAETENMNLKSMLSEMNIKEISIVYGRSGVKDPQTIYDKNEINEIIELFLDGVSVSSDKQVVSDFTEYCFGAYPDSYLSVSFIDESDTEISFIIYEKTKLMILTENQTMYVCNTNYSDNYELLKEKLK